MTEAQADVLDEIINRLQAVVPPRVSLVRADGVVQINVDGAFWAKIGVEHFLQRQSPSELAALAQQLASAVQDIIAESSGEPWPGRLSVGSRDLALPFASVDRGVLTMWFGSEDERVLACGPLTLENREAV